MSRYKAYSEYKLSGIPWLGNVPSHWAVSKVKHLTSFQVGWTPPTKDDENFEGDNLWANISDLKEREIFETAKRVSDGAVKTAAMTITPKGSLLYSFKLSVGAVSFAGNDMYTNEAIASFLKESKLPLAYLYYVLPKYLIENASTNIYGARILNQELICNANLIAPTFEEAQNIANFLDHETAKIDALIEKQQRLIELLKEKRQAVISRAVTKGLNPNAPIKDSGVKWLGEVPAHWIVAPLKHLCLLLKDGTHLPPPRVEEGVPLLSVRNIVNGQFVLREDDSLISQFAFEALCKPFSPRVGDVLLAIVGATLGKVAIVKDMPSFHIQRSLAVFRIKPDFLTSEFLANVFASAGFQSLLWENAGFSAQPGIYLGSLANFKIPIPPKSEQLEIDAYCNAKASKLDELISKAETAISLMQERRTALISAAVTGKIDVRDWQAAA